MSWDGGITVLLTHFRLELSNQNSFILEVKIPSAVSGGGIIKTIIMPSDRMCLDEGFVKKF